MENNSYKSYSDYKIYIKTDWEKLLGQFPEANFLQSWQWGEFNRNIGNKIYCVKIPATKGSANWRTFCGCFLAVVENAKRGRYLTIPGGPLSRKWDINTFQKTVSLMEEIAIKENCSFIRIRPQILDNEIAMASTGAQPYNGVMRSFGFRPAPMHLHAELTRVLDLTKSDKELLKEMRKGTRYEIRKASKMGIKVYQSNDEKLIDEFVKLQAETAEREHFVPFSGKYLLEQFKAFNKDGMVKLFYINQPHKETPSRGRSLLCNPISMAFVIFYRGEAVYHYSASSNEARKIPAAYAIQWAIIQEAKKRGCKTYNLWGDVADNQLGKHRFSGPSLFKRGFGGTQIAYLHAHDLPLKKNYWINYAIEVVRKRIRSL